MAPQKGVGIAMVIAFIQLAVLLPTSSSERTRIASVVLEGSKYIIKEGVQEGWIATGNFTDDMLTHGWSYLTIDTSDDYDDLVQAYAAGFLEGNLTASYIKMMWNNVMNDFCKTHSQKCEAINNFLTKNSLWTWNKIHSYKNNIYWHQVGLVLQQLVGMEAAYYGNRSLDQKPKVDIFGLLLLQIKEELDDISAILGFPTNWGHRPLGSGSCSALVKLLPDNTDLLVAHTTWSAYNEMLRVIKKYNLAYNQSPKSKDKIPGREIAFTSYPGVLHSVDDFYITSHGMVVMETTIGNFNQDLWKFSTPDSLLTWIRVLVANRIADSGYDWVEAFRQYNMGTYNNQWMVIDYSKFTPGKNTSDGLFTVVEQLPGYVEGRDFTAEMYLEKNSYWASYNLPYFTNIYTMSGVQSMYEQYGDFFSYQNCPRAKMFKRNQTDVMNVDSMLRLIRYNDYKNDPLSACNCTPPYSAENAISARSDLNPCNGSYYLKVLGHRCHGGIDAKITSSSMVTDLAFVAVSGPTSDQQVPFQWSKSDFEQTFPHEGMADLFDFEPVRVNWEK